MNRKFQIALAITAVLGLCHIFFNTEWIRPDPIQIQAQVRELSPRASLEKRLPAVRIDPNDPKLPKDPVEREKALKALRAANRKENKAGQPGNTTGEFEGVYPVVFALDGEYQLTAVRVIEETPSVPGKAPIIFWQLDSASNSLPTKAIVYGRIPRGMKLKDDRNKPMKLNPATTYRLEVQAGRYKGSTTFKTKEQVEAEGE